MAFGRQNVHLPASEQLPMAQRLAGMSAGIRALIPDAEVRLFGSRARGEARADSDVDLLVTVPDDWLAGQDRLALLAELWGAVAQPDLSVDLVLHSSGEAARRLREPGSLCMRPSARVCYSVITPEAARLLRVARRDLKMARRLVDPDVEEASWGWATQQSAQTDGNGASAPRGSGPHARHLRGHGWPALQ